MARKASLQPWLVIEVDCESSDLACNLSDTCQRIGVEHQSTLGLLPHLCSIKFQLLIIIN